jgi:acyl-CoA thioesterase
MNTNPESAARASGNIASMLERDAFSRWLGIEVIEHGPGRCTLQMRVREDMVNGFGVSHGGIVFSLADSAMAFACNTGEHVTVALDNSISYAAAVKAGDELIAAAHEESASNRHAFYRVSVRRRDNAVVALFRGTVYRTQQQHPESAS